MRSKLLIGGICATIIIGSVIMYYCKQKSISLPDPKLVAATKISFKNQNLLGPARIIKDITGSLNLEIVNASIDEYYFLFHNIEDVKFMVEQIGSLPIWKSIYIHDSCSGLLEIRTDQPGETICVHVKSDGGMIGCHFT